MRWESLKQQRISGIDTAELVITAAIDEFNKRLEEDEFPYRLDTQPSLYSLKIAKKSGKPKSDYPGRLVSQIRVGSGHQADLCEFL